MTHLLPRFLIEDLVVKAEDGDVSLTAIGTE